MKVPNLIPALNDFQQTENIKALSLCEEQGIFGTLVDMIARIMHEVNLQPLKEFTYLFNLGSFVTGGVRVRYKLLHILLSGTHFHKTKVFPSLRYPVFIKGNDWLIDDHIEIVRNLLLNRKILRSSLEGQRISTTSICMNSFFARKMLDDPADALDWF